MLKPSIHKIIKYSLKAIIIITSALTILASCDDDPLVVPAGTEEEDCTGSYCKLEKNEDDFLTNYLAFLNLKKNPKTF
ncbi:hypothetical protein [Xanthovirga aplysinae]|uniref:hypothetical protein n=1 Tax=Xanthovirga aplysinae TaxID=2529853 RepID=UPI0012BC356D|nr:hypothetical protein [Xanthovirga aplysinae]MTI32201.1 hypothetical protein [Xanthovirga aplysinae]